MPLLVLESSEIIDKDVRLFTNEYQFDVLEISSKPGQSVIAFYSNEWTVRHITDYNELKSFCDNFCSVVIMKELTNEFENSVYLIYSDSAFGIITEDDNQDIKMIFVERAIAATGLYYGSTKGINFASDSLESIRFSLGCIKKFTVTQDFIKKSLIINPSMTNFTPYPDIHRIMSGHYVVFKKKKWRDQSRWYFPVVLRESITEDDIKHALISSLGSMLDSDKIIGLSFSGGIDSTSILLLLSKYFYQGSQNKNINTITWHYPYQRFGDEKQFAEKAIEKIGIQKSFFLEDTDVYNLGRMLDYYNANKHHYDYPSLAVLMAERIHKVKELCLNEGIELVLSGHGGDFIFDNSFGAFVSGKKNSIKKIIRDTYRLAETRQSNFWYELSHNVLKPFYTNRFDEYIQKEFSNSLPDFYIINDRKEHLEEIRDNMRMTLKNVSDVGIRLMLLSSLLYDDLSHVKLLPKHVHPFLNPDILHKVLSYNVQQDYPYYNCNIIKKLLKSVMDDQETNELISRNGKSRTDWISIDAINKHKHNIIDTVKKGWLVENNLLKFGVWEELVKKVIEGNKSGVVEVLKPLSLEIWLSDKV